MPRMTPERLADINHRMVKAMTSVAKAHPLLVMHAPHIDGEFDNATSEVCRLWNLLSDELDAVTRERDTLAKERDEYLEIARKATGIK